MNAFTRFVLNTETRLLCPIVSYPDPSLSGVSAFSIVTNAQAQVSAATAIYHRYKCPVVLSCMDLSIEAEAFGSAIQMSQEEAPTVIGRLVTDSRSVQALPIPKVGEKRTQVALDVVAQLKQLPNTPWVIGSTIGPLSLAARLYGAQEALELTVMDPPLLHLLLEKCTAFLSEYVEAFKALGADGVFMCEPVAGLLSPSQMRVFSSSYVKRLCATADEQFALILHDCAAKRVHLDAKLASGATMHHFGAPMDMKAALASVPSDVVLWGNLNPSTLFNPARPQQVTMLTRELLEATKGHSNFVLSTGCDLPPATSVANLDALFEAGRSQ